jgi:hypothetical protein
MPILDFNIELQQHNNWCWAAVAVSVDRYFDRKSTWCQCRVASKMAKMEKLKVKNCGTCQKPKHAPKACNRPWSLDKALKIVDRLKGKPPLRPLTFEQTERRIKAGRPVCVRIQWGGGQGGHFVVISGYATGKSGSRWVDVEDPHAGSSTWRYDEFRENYQYAQGHWVETYAV